MSFFYSLPAASPSSPQSLCPPSSTIVGPTPTSAMARPDRPERRYFRSPCMPGASNKPRWPPLLPASNGAGTAASPRGGWQHGAPPPLPQEKCGAAENRGRCCWVGWVCSERCAARCPTRHLARTASSPPPPPSSPRRASHVTAPSCLTQE